MTWIYLKLTNVLRYFESAYSLLHFICSRSFAMEKCRINVYVLDMNIEITLYDHDEFLLISLFFLLYV